MSRHQSSGSQGHSITSIGWGDYRLHWSVDRYYPGSRLRHPRSCHRDTDLAGAIRFALKHGCLKMPDEVRKAVEARKGIEAVIGSGSQIADAHSKDPSRPAMPKEEDADG